MTPPILKELFDSYRKKGISFCINHQNYNKTDAFFDADDGVVRLSGGGGILAILMAILLPLT